MLLSLITITAILQATVATNVSPPILYSRHGSQSQHGSLSPSLEKRGDCGDGTRCLLGTCCGDGCAMNCCALDNGGLGCGITERCQFKGNLDTVSRCWADDGRRGCTGEATRVTVHTPYSTVTLGATTATTEVSTTTTDTSTTTEQSFTAISTATATATATTTTSSESESSSRVSASSSSAGRTSTTTSTTDHSPRLTGGSQISPSPSPSPNPNGGSGVGVGVPVLAGMVALGAFLL
ncbi:hypothetical protein CNMCM5793_009381 [Aspergillus hiratsukae]|uniref:GPI anchored protein n=1 Tax=Aspergillus hiratsukae TaxID=1194566 RepID=A0A8H6ULH0_9EURO|nr:hypothetical protein CNMCM5793_009381 [Aspergillus hiratsukae]KAF7155751.1 hypothetical protein CNMCM6106_007016 [Aspergillus hiratsukae]KAF7155780.1 hypothetical protein CNMCM6106_007045 [Aspergillus hiratsukae]